MRKWGRTAACAAALTVLAGLAAGCSSSSSPSSTSAMGGIGLEGSLPTNFGPPEETTVKVGAVPAMNSAGFMVALQEGLSAKEGLHVIYSPAISSETAVAQQLKGQLDIS